MQNKIGQSGFVFKQRNAALKMIARQNTTTFISFEKERASGWLVFAAAIFNLALCFGQTQSVIAGSTFQIALCEISILAAASFRSRHYFGVTEFSWTSVIFAYIVSLTIINRELDVKIVRDLAIMVVFYKLGTASSLRCGDYITKALVVVVLAVGTIEFAAPELFGRMFNIREYYLSKGLIDLTQENLTESTLFTSGNRGEDAGRFWFEFIFGSHRVSSIFLEPTSMGNFGIICAAWFITRYKEKPISSGLFLLLTFLVIIYGDSRFASLAIIFLVLVRLMNLQLWFSLAFWAPVLVMSALILFALFNPSTTLIPDLLEDNFRGRLLYSGQILVSWGWPNWFALSPSPVTTVDTGYAYFINNFGIFPTLLLWWSFATRSSSSEDEQILNLLLAIYIALALCIGASIFSIKTSALCWYLWGAVKSSRGREIGR